MVQLNLIQIREHEAMYLRSKGFFVPQYNRDHKTKYLAIENEQILKLLNEYRESITLESHF